MGARVVLIEEGKLGVERVAAGDVPVKALVGAARRAEAIRTCGLFGIKPPKTGAGFAEANDEDRKSTRLNSSHSQQSRMPSSA